MDTEVFPFAGGPSDVKVNLVKARRHFIMGLTAIEEAKTGLDSHTALAACNISAVRNLIACLDNTINSLISD